MHDTYTITEHETPGWWLVTFRDGRITLNVRGQYSCAVEAAEDLLTEYKAQNAHLNALNQMLDFVFDDPDPRPSGVFI